MTTKDTTTIERKFDLWRKSPYLSVDEAMNLIMGFIPGTYIFRSPEDQNMQDIPNDSIPIFRELIRDILEFKLGCYIRGYKITSLKSIVEICDMFQEDVVSPAAYYQSWWWYDVKILTVDLKKWLHQKGFPSTFFETKAANIPDYLNSELEEHSYKLAAAVKAWEHFYTHGLAKPNKSLKENIEAWLTENAKQLNLLHNNKISTQAIKDVAKIVNWQTKGGAPKS